MKGKFPNGLAAALLQKGVKDADLARSLNTAAQNVSRWKLGERKLPTPMAKRIGALLDVDPGELIIPSQPAPRAERGKRRIDGPFVNAAAAALLLAEGQRLMRAEGMSPYRARLLTELLLECVGVRPAQSEERHDEVRPPNTRRRAPGTAQSDAE